MKEFNLSPQISRTDGNTIRIKVPASVAFDLAQMNIVTKSVLAELGCSACHSGHDLRFDFEREFIFDKKLNINKRF